MTTLEIESFTLKSRIADCHIALLSQPVGQLGDADGSDDGFLLGVPIGSVDAYGVSIGDAEGILLGSALHLLGPYTKAACPYVKGDAGTDALAHVLFKLEATFH